MSMNDRDQSVPLENVAADIGQAFAEAAGQATAPAEPVPAETARLMDEAFGRAVAIALSPNVLPFARPARRD